MEVNESRQGGFREKQRAGLEGRGEDSHGNNPRMQCPGSALRRPLLTEVAAELAHHVVGVGSGDLREPRENQNIAVFERSLVHGLTDKKKF